MFEKIAVLIGRRVHLRGVGRLLRSLYPCRTDSTRFIRGTRARGDGMLIELDTREVIDWSQLFLGEYEHHLGALFQLLLTEGAVAIDVGANVGAHSLTLGRLVGPSGRVLAFEPNPPVREKLNRNIVLNSLHHIEVFPNALGADESRMALRVPASGTPEFSNQGLASLVALDTPHDLVEIDVRPLDSFITSHDLHQVDLVKIDVQGYECSVFEGMAKLIDQLMPAIVFEYEKWAWDKAGKKLEDAIKILSRQQYSFWKIGYDNGLRLSPISPASSQGSHVEILALANSDSRVNDIENVKCGVGSD